MINLTELQFEAIRADKKHQLQSDITCQIAGLLYRKDMESVIFEEDVADAFLKNIKDKWDCSGWDDGDLISWIRELQQESIDNAASRVFVSLEQFIADNFKSQKEFAERQGVKPPQVTQWLDKNFIVADGVLYSPRRDLYL